MAIVEREIPQDRHAVSPKPFRLTKKQYYRMGELGFFVDDRVELIEGEIIAMSPIGSRHWVTVNRLNRILAKLLPTGFTLSVQNSIDTSSRSEPVPDLAIVSGNEFDYIDGLPKTAALAIEVSDTSLRHDRRKLDLYARAGFAECWIVNLKARCVEVYRQPIGDRELPGTGKFCDSTVAVSGEIITAVAVPNIAIAVSELLP